MAALLFSVTLNAQKTTYFIRNLDTVASKQEAETIAVVDRTNGKGYNKSIRIYNLNDTLLRESFYMDTMKVLTWRTYFETGQLKEEFVWDKNELLQLNTYWPKGALKRKERHEHGIMIEGKCFTASGKEMTFYPYEVMPEFPGGDSMMNNYIATHIKVPRAFLEHGKSGKVVISFIVDSTGKIINAKVVQQHMPETDAEALRVLNSMPLWKPGKQDGLPVRVNYTLPITFEITE